MYLDTDVHFSIYNLTYIFRAIEQIKNYFVRSAYTYLPDYASRLKYGQPESGDCYACLS